MNLPAHSIRRLRKLLNFSLGGLGITKEEAKEGLRILAGQQKSEKQKTYQKALRAEKATAHATRMQKSRALYAAVFERPGWPCELGEHDPCAHVDLHHLKAGSAKRFFETVKNCIRACAHCHRRWHNKGPEEFRAAVERLCKQHGYPMPSVYTRRAA